MRWEGPATIHFLIHLVAAFPIRPVDSSTKGTKYFFTLLAPAANAYMVFFVCSRYSAALPPRIKLPRLRESLLPGFTKVTSIQNSFPCNSTTMSANLSTRCPPTSRILLPLFTTLPPAPISNSFGNFASPLQALTMAALSISTPLW